ncbi:MAG: NAD(P)H-binding protein [Pelolinea sp.]|nr:NAD(P)H-binding protein [Pelolinea sp.]
MILVTGGTGFIGSRVLLRLVQSRFPIKVLLRPKKGNTRLPLDLSLNAAVSSLNDRRSLRAVLSGVDTVLHFASAENEIPHPDLEGVDVMGTETLIKASVDAGVRKFLFLSRNGADKNSMYPLLKAKALAEDEIKTSGLDFTILRVTDVFGENDHFSNQLAGYIKASPGIVPLPEGGKMILQPLWIEDLISSIFLILEDDLFQNSINSIGGGEFLEFREIIKIIMQKTGKRKIPISVSPAYLRIYNLWFKQSKGGFPLSSIWLDLLAVDRTCGIDSLPRVFKLMPARFSHHLSHLLTV